MDRPIDPVLPTPARQMVALVGGLLLRAAIVGIAIAVLFVASACSVGVL